MDITETLEILIPSYNRCKDLSSSLQQLLANDSPVRTCRITILDNHSTDDTQKLCIALQTQYPNVRYIRHPKNIGMGANICAAMAMANKPYYWIVGDDESYDFSHWSEVEKALDQDPDCVVVGDFTLVDKSELSIIHQVGLLSAGIYKTANVTTEVLQNAYASILYMFPHFALVFNLINEHKKFIIVPPLIIWGVNNPDPQGKAYVRGALTESHLWVRLKRMWIMPAFYTMIEQINDKNIRTICANDGYKYNKLNKGKNGFLSNRHFIRSFVKTNATLFDNYYANYIAAFFALNWRNKVWLIFYYLWFKVKV